MSISSFNLNVIQEMPQTQTTDQPTKITHKRRNIIKEATSSDNYKTTYASILYGRRLYCRIKDVLSSHKLTS